MRLVGSPHKHKAGPRWTTVLLEGRAQQCFEFYPCHYPTEFGHCINGHTCMLCKWTFRQGWCSHPPLKVHHWNWSTITTNSALWDAAKGVPSSMCHDCLRNPAVQGWERPNCLQVLPSWYQYSWCWQLTCRAKFFWHRIFQSLVRWCVDAIIRICVLCHEEVDDLALFWPWQSGVSEMKSLLATHPSTHTMDSRKLSVVHETDIFKFGPYPLPAGQIVPFQFLGIFMYLCELMSGPCLRWVTCGPRAILEGYSQFYPLLEYSGGCCWLSDIPSDGFTPKSFCRYFLGGAFWDLLEVLVSVGSVCMLKLTSSSQLRGPGDSCLQVEPRGFDYIGSGVVG